MSWVEDYLVEPFDCLADVAFKKSPAMPTR